MVSLIRYFFILLLLFSQSIFSQEGNTTNKQKFNPELYNQLPAKIRESKQILAVNDGTSPPYIIYEADGTLTGASIELFEAVSEILGVTIKHEVTNGVGGILLGTQSGGRYDLSLGPLGDTLERQKKHDFIAYSISYAAAAILKGNPKKIYSYDDFCGNRAGVSSGGIGEKILMAKSAECEKEGKSPIELSLFKDMPSMALALRANRIDVFSTVISIISYYVANSNDELELIPLESDNYFYYSAVVSKDSPLGPIILAALQELYDNGTYTRIMEKWHMQATMLDQPGINLAK